MRFDDNAEFRQKEIFDERDWSQEDAKEVEASRYNLNYIALDGKYFPCMNYSNLKMYIIFASLISNFLNNGRMIKEVRNYKNVIVEIKID